MEKGFFQELKHYSLYEIAKELKIKIEDTKRLIGILKKYGVVKSVKVSKPDYEELSNQDIILTDVTDSVSESEYVFDFVGVVLLEGHVFKCFPKYILSTLEPMQQFKKVLKVIKKYNSKEQLVYLYNGDDNKIFNRLAITLHLLEEYFKYGVYTNQHEIIEINGEGEILWDKTINETFAFIQNSKPYYMELQTQNIVDNDTDYFKRLHECVLTQCALELKANGLLEIFEIAYVELTESQLEEFGDMDYILYRLEREIQTQYITRKQKLLKTLYTYIANRKTNKNDVTFSLYGTNSYNLIWEKVCSENFGSLLDEKISDLPLGVSPEYQNKAFNTLRSIIDKPVWHKNQPSIFDDKVNTLKPDLVCIYPCNKDYDYCFGIYDAKYYRIEFIEQANGWKVTGQPGVGDVTKQYLYQLAFDEFIIKQGYTFVQNMFLCPQEEMDIDYGYVEMNMLHTIGDRSLENIVVVKLSADEMYDYYLTNKKIENITRYIPQIGKKIVNEQSFAKRMMSYLKYFAPKPQLFEDKRRFNTTKKILFYPEVLTREVGAKLIYDIICSVATSCIYNFEPYMKEESNMVADSTTNSDKICQKIAEVALEIEYEIKVSTNEQLQSQYVVSDKIKQLISNKELVGHLIQENAIMQINEGIDELVKKIYL